MLNYIAQHPEQSDKPIRWIPALVLGLICLNIFYTTLFGNTRPTTPLVYSAVQIWKRRLTYLYFIFGYCIIIIGFVQVLFLNDPKTTLKDIGSMVVVNIIVVLLFATVWYYYRKKLREAGPFGRSELFVPAGLPARPGQKLNVSLHCLGLPVNTDRFTATLRNIREHYVSKRKRKGKSTPRLKTIFITEESQQIHVAGPTTDFIVWINPKGAITTYELHEPVYWELEVRDTASGYYARFFLDVV